MRVFIYLFVCLFVWMTKTEAFLSEYCCYDSRCYGKLFQCWGCLGGLWFLIGLFQSLTLNMSSRKSEILQSVSTASGAQSEHKLCANISGSELKQRELCEKGKLETLISCVQEWLPQSEEARQCGDPPQASSSPMSHPCPRSLSLSLAISLSLSLSLSLPLSPSLLSLSLSLSPLSLSLSLSLNSVQFNSVQLNCFCNHAGVFP